MLLCLFSSSSRRLGQNLEGCFLRIPESAVSASSQNISSSPGCKYHWVYSIQCSWARFFSFTLSFLAYQSFFAWITRKKYNVQWPPSVYHKLILDCRTDGRMWQISDNACGKKRPVAFLQHGLLGSSADWVTNLPNESLGNLCWSWRNAFVFISIF